MPNWCKNKLTVMGDHEKITAFIAQARGVGNFFKQQKFELDWEEKRKEKEGAAYKTHEQRFQEEIYEFSFHQLIPLPDFCHGAEYDSVGYNAERNTWGCKWGGSDTQLMHFVRKNYKAMATYEYTTPWSPGHLFLTKLAAKFPELMFLISFKEEYPSRGKFFFKDGVEQKEHTVFETAGRDGMPSFSGNTKYYSTHNKWAKEKFKELTND